MKRNRTSKRNISNMQVWVFIFLLLSSCSPYSLQAPIDPDGPYKYERPDNVDFRLSSYEAGADASHTLSFDIKQGEIQTSMLDITYYPYAFSEFTFNGFLAIGPPNTQIGEYSIDFDFDGQPDFVMPILSIDENYGYADINSNGIFDGSFFNTSGNIDVYIYHQLAGSSEGACHDFRIYLPLGGDGNASFTGSFSGRVTAVMYAGILTNPPFAGQYEAHATFYPAQYPAGISWKWDKRTITIMGEPGPLTITTGWLAPNAIVNKPYSATLRAVNGTPPYRWEIESGGTLPYGQPYAYTGLPPGVALDSDTGVISGTPTKTGSFYFVVRVTDAAHSTATRKLGVNVQEPIDWGNWLPDIDPFGGGGCFIATAAYGSALHPHVNALREFRDNHLKKTAAGQALVSLYERVSPPLASVIARHKTLRLISRAALAPVVYAVVYPKAFWICSGFLLIGVCAARLRKKRKSD